MGRGPALAGVWERDTMQHRHAATRTTIAFGSASEPTPHGISRALACLPLICPSHVLVDRHLLKNDLELLALAGKRCNSAAGSVAAQPVQFSSQCASDQPSGNKVTTEIRTTLRFRSRMPSISYCPSDMMPSTLSLVPATVCSLQ